MALLMDVILQCSYLFLHYCVCKLLNEQDEQVSLTISIP